jgi:anti-anti-sigma factor
MLEAEPPQSTSLSLDADACGDVRVIRAEGELDLANAPGLCATLSEHNGHRSVLLDMTQVGFCDSTGLKALIDAARELEIARRRLVVVVPGEGAVRRLVTMTGAQEFLEIASSRTEGLTALGAESA